MYVKFRRNRANINIVIGIKSGLSHIHWFNTFQDEKEESVEIGDVNFHKKSWCDEKFANKKNGEQASEYNMECMLF